jgi:hypothetical protein
LAVYTVTRGQHRLIRLSTAIAARIPRVNPETVEIEIRNAAGRSRLWAPTDAG